MVRMTLWSYTTLTDSAVVGSLLWAPGCGCNIGGALLESHAPQTSSDSSSREPPPRIREANVRRRRVTGVTRPRAVYVEPRRGIASSSAISSPSRIVQESHSDSNLVLVRLPGFELR
jgi:hypothetical protein